MYSDKRAYFLNEFYSKNRVESWLKVLGPNGHYHFGQTNPEDLTENIMDYAIRYLYKFIPNNGTILDCGCGWGGPARLLAQEKNCNVTGVTISEAQYCFIKEQAKEIDVVCSDLHKYKPKTKFDCALFVESFTHLADPRKVLSNLFDHVDAILLREYITKRQAGYSSLWNMNFFPKEEIINILRECNYELLHYEEVLTPEDVKKSAKYWLDGLAKLKSGEKTGQLELLKAASSNWIRQNENLPWSIALFYATKIKCHINPPPSR